MICVLDAPSNLGLKQPTPEREPGTRHAPRVLRELGLVARLGARSAAPVVPPAWSGLRDPASGVLHAPLLGPYACWIADALGPILERGEFALLLGGDCSILLGSALALKRRGRHGLLFLDGHRDLLTPERSQSGGAAGMDLALATGHGPESLARIDGELPLLAPDQVLLFGYRDADRWYDPALLELATVAMRAVALEDARIEGLERALQRRLDALLASGVAGFWIHLDVDVLDDRVMYAVDSREPDGMTFEELEQVLALAVASGRCLGMHVTIYDPERDPGRVCGRGLVDALVRGLAGLVRR